MHRLRLILGFVLAFALVGGSAVIVYTDRPVMRLGDVAANAALAAGAARPPAGGAEAEGGGEDEGESEEGEGGALAIVPTASAPSPSTQPSTGNGTPAPAPGTYSMTDIRQHGTTSSCWSAINGSVYDLTDWINRHPGGSSVIVALCGVDGSAAYNGQHGGQQRPQYYLALFKIGALR